MIRIEGGEDLEKKNQTEADMCEECSSVTRETATLPRQTASCSSLLIFRLSEAFRHMCVCTGAYKHKHTWNAQRLIDSYSDGRGCWEMLKRKKASLDGRSAFKHHSPYTREQCVTQWCCQRNQTPFLLHWRRSKSYRHRPQGCPWAGSLVCRQSQQRPGLQETHRNKNCQPTRNEIRRSSSLWHQHSERKYQLHQGLGGGVRSRNNL